jgi:hypothetical protein
MQALTRGVELVKTANAGQHIARVDRGCVVSTKNGRAVKCAQYLYSRTQSRCMHVLEKLIYASAYSFIYRLQHHTLLENYIVAIALGSVL